MSNRLILCFIALLGCLGATASAIYAPSLPEISKIFNTEMGHVQWTMSIFMLGMGLSQIIYGPISEVYGRQPTILIGLVIMFIGTVLCIFAPNIEVLLAGRAIQGVGSGVTPLFRAVFRDCFSGATLAKYVSYLSAIVNFFIPAAPIIGGYLQETLGWRSSFILIAIYITLVLYLTKFKFEETNQFRSPERSSLKFVLTSYLKVLKDPVFIGYSFISFFTFGSFFSWDISGPVLLIKVLGYSPSQFGWITFLIVFPSMFGVSLINARFVKSIGTHIMLRCGLILTFLSPIFLFIGYFAVGTNIFAVILPLVLLFGGAAFIFGNAVANAFAPYASIGGYASSLYSFIQLIGGGTVGAVLSTFPKNSPLYFTLSIFCCTLISLCIFEGFIYPKHKKEVTSSS